MSTARAKSGHSRTPMKWASAASAMAAKSLRPCTGAALLDQRRRHRPVVQHVDLVDGAEVDRWHDLDAMEELLPAGLDQGHGADRDAARIDPVDPRCPDAVARRHVGREGDVVELELVPPPAAT